MDSKIEELELILDVSDQIRETLFGSGFEDFRNNRKLKIDIIAKILTIIEAIEKSELLLSNHILPEKFSEIANIKNNIISGATGISEEYIWQICKRDLALLTREVKILLRLHQNK